MRIDCISVPTNEEGTVCGVMRKAGEISLGCKGQISGVQGLPLSSNWALDGICALQEVSQFLRTSVSLPKNLD